MGGEKVPVPSTLQKSVLSTSLKFLAPLKAISMRYSLYLILKATDFFDLYFANLFTYCSA